MPTIRPYRPTDAECVYEVSLGTGSKQAREKAGPARTMQFTSYVDYYLEHEPQNCFVAADEDDNAVGFILAARDYLPYREIFLRGYAPRTKGYSLPLRIECLGTVYMPQFFYKKYPAHLHIDILPAYQRMGFGTALMDALTAHLRAQGVPGVMLGVGSKNEKGKRFYRKYGFKKIGRVPFSIAMGLEL